MERQKRGERQEHVMGRERKRRKKVVEKWGLNRGTTKGGERHFGEGDRRLERGRQGNRLREWERDDWKRGEIETKMQRQTDRKGQRERDQSIEEKERETK